MQRLVRATARARSPVSSVITFRTPSVRGRAGCGLGHVDVEVQAMLRGRTGAFCHESSCE